jgi:hypothetical protein
MDTQPSKRALSDRAAALALLCGLFAATSAFAQWTNSTLAEIAAYSGPDRIAKLIAGAKNEGAVNIYSSETVEDMARSAWRSRPNTASN